MSSGVGDSEPEMIDCDCAGAEGAFVEVPLLQGAPSGWICRACGESVEVNPDRTTRPHKHPDILGWLRRA